MARTAKQFKSSDSESESEDCNATPPQGGYCTHVVLLFMLRQHPPYRHQEAIPAVLYLERLLHISRQLKEHTTATHDVGRTVSSSSASSSLRSSISCTRSRRMMSLPTRRPGIARGVGYGCCGRGMRVGNIGGRGRTVGVATMRVNYTRV